MFDNTIEQLFPSLNGIIVDDPDLFLPFPTAPVTISHLTQDVHRIYFTLNQDSVKYKKTKKRVNGIKQNYKQLHEIILTRNETFT